jgi:hypothetical protein
MAACVTTANADIFISWTAGFGFYQNGGTGGNTAGQGIMNFNGGSTLVYFYWTPTAVIDPADPGDAQFAGGDDVFLGQYTVTMPPATEWGDYGVPTNTVYLDSTYGVGSLQTGFIYARIFQDGSPAAGDYYNDGAAMGPADGLTIYTGGADPADTYFHTPSNDLELNQQIVPEPATLAFMGIGSLLIAVRRSRKS